MNRQLVLSIPLHSQATLADFSWGNNALLKTHLDHALNHNTDKIFYIWGEPGCGKSHLLQAYCHEVSPVKSTVYLPLKILKDWGPDTLDGMDEQALIALDDIDAIAGIPEWEEALFHFYNRVRDRGESILLITGHDAPANLPIALADLRSRLTWGLVTQLYELNDELKILILQQQAKKRGFVLSDHIATFLLNRCSRNMHHLYQILERLDIASLSAKRKITLPFVKSILDI